MVNNKTEDANTRSFHKFHEIELEKVFDALLSLQNFRVQLGTFFGTVNLAGLSVALTTNKASVIFLAGTLIWMFIFLDYIVMRTLIGYCYRGLQLQALFAPDDQDTYFNMFLLFLQKKREKHLKEISKISDRESRNDALRQMPLKYPTIAGFWIPLFISLVEVFLGFILICHFQWKIF